MGNNLNCVSSSASASSHYEDYEHHITSNEDKTSAGSGKGPSHGVGSPDKTSAPLHLPFDTSEGSGGVQPQDGRYALGPVGGVRVLPDCGLKPHRGPALRTPSSSSPAQGKIVVALHPYSAREDGDLSLKKGDRLLVLNDSDPDWWDARLLPSPLEGRIPQNHMAFEKTVESEDWFLGDISRKDAERMLMLDSNAWGTFLIRSSEKVTGERFHALSIRDFHPTKGAVVRHYKVKTADNGHFFITSKKTFPTLQQLVSYYTEDANGLCHRLTSPCPKPEPVVWDLSQETRDAWEIPRESVQLVRKLGSGNFGDVWYGMPNRKVIESVGRGYRLPKPANYECPDNVYSIMLSCWDAKPERRPTFKSLYVFFDDYSDSTEPSTVGQRQ